MKKSGANHFSKDRWSLVRLIDAAIYGARGGQTADLSATPPPPLSPLRATTLGKTRSP
jgi:hypothetical protein